MKNKKSLFTALQSKKASVSSTQKKIPYTSLVITTFTMSFLTIVIPFVLKNNLPPEVPLFYGLPDGGKQLATQIYLSLPGVTSFCIAFVNTMVAYFINDKFLKQALLVGSFGVALLTAITTFQITTLIGSF